MESLDSSNALKKPDISAFPLKEIKIAAQNYYIYERCGLDNEDDRLLLHSIREYGIEEPLSISSDGYLVSGHRRHWAATRIGLENVPVRIIEVTFGLLSPKDQLSLLRRYNLQREKTFSEKLRETSIEIDPKVAYEKLRMRRVRQTIRSIRDKGNIELGQRQKRPRITTTKFLSAVKKVVFENKEYWPLTDRRLHYLLLNNPPLRHDKKPESYYQNNISCYKALTDLITRARLSNDIPMHAIEDPTRPVCLSQGFDNFQQFFKQEVKNFLYGYHRDLTQGQEAHIEVLLEKAALRSVVEKVASEYCIPVTTTRGYSSLSPRYEIVQRFRRSGKSRLVLLIFADFDPDGEQIAASTARSLRDDFHVLELSMRAVKVGLTHEDVQNNEFPSDLEAKPSSPNYAKFILKYGSRVVELDAAPVKWIQEKLREAIEAELDMNEFRAQEALEQEDSVELQSHRRQLIEVLQFWEVDEDDDEDL